jgi:N-acetylmuramoyl-L-alanine amidase
LLITYKGSRVNFAYCRPQALDLAVGGQWHRLDRLLRDYQYPWARASNANYFGKTMQGEAKDSGGAIYDTQIINGRPAVYVKGSRAWFSYDHLEVHDADVAVGAGPMLVVDGVIGDLEGRIRYGDFSGLRQTNKCERCAIGYTTTGLLLHVVADALTLYELAQFFIEKGCTWAMNLDGGSSVGLLEGDSASFNTAKRIPSALVIREVVEEVERKMVVMCPGHGGSDPGSVGNGLKEKDLTLDISKRVATFLTDKGVNVVLTRDGDETVSIEERIRRCNETNTACYVMVHINAATPKEANGIETFAWHTSAKGVSLAELLQKHAVEATGLAWRVGAPKKSTSGTSGYYKGLRLTKCPAAIIECGFITNAKDAAYLNVVANRSAFAWAIGKAIHEWLGRV